MLEPILFLFTGILGIITIAIMITSYRSNRFINMFLMLIVVITSIRFLIHGSYELAIQSLLNPDKGLSSILYLIIVPCFYLYHKSLVFPKAPFSLKNFKHLIFIVFLYLINSIPSLKDGVLFYYGFATNFLLLGAFISFYLVITFNLLRKTIWQRTDIPIHDTHFNLIKSWTIYLFTLNTLGGISLLVAVYSEFTTGINISGKSMALLSLAFWLFIYFKILISPEILYGLPILNKKLLQFSQTSNKKDPTTTKINKHWTLNQTIKKNDKDTRLQEKIKSDIRSYIREVERLCLIETIFRDSKCSHVELAHKMGVPTSHIVYLFKYHSKMPFSEYRMNIRVQDAIKLIQSDYLKLNTLESLAYKTGFASYNPFFIAFKKITGHPPQVYLKTLNNLHPIVDSKIQYEKTFD